MAGKYKKKTGVEIFSHFLKRETTLVSTTTYFKIDPDWKSPLSKVPLVCVSGSKILGLSLLNHLAMKIACSNINKELVGTNPSIIWERRCCLYIIALLQKSPCTFAPLMTHGWAAWTKSLIIHQDCVCVFMWSIFSPLFFFNFHKLVIIRYICSTGFIVIKIWLNVAAI